MTSVIITDDHPIVTEGLKNLLTGRPDITLAACCSNGEQTLSALQTEAVDVVLLDINLPDISGIQLCRKIKQLHADVRVIALSIHNERAVILSMLQNGANGYVLKNALGEEILQAIQTVMNGHVYLCKATEKAMKDVETDELTAVPHITRREKEILQLAGQGYTTQQMADKLFISTHTVESHRKKLMAKFEVNNMTSVIRLATQYNLLS